MLIRGTFKKTIMRNDLNAIERLFCCTAKNERDGEIQEITTGMNCLGMNRVGLSPVLCKYVLRGALICTKIIFSFEYFEQQMSMLFNT